MPTAKKGNFTSNFGFVMASVGSAIGLGNIWGFPYKMGANGGFAFLLIYIVMVAVIGYPIMLSEITLGRKTGKAALGAFKEANPKFTFNGVFEMVTPFLLLCFYIVLGGIVIKYLFANLGDMFGKSWGTQGLPAENFFEEFLSSSGSVVFFTFLFLGLTAYVVIRGIERGIEKFCSIGMPLLFIIIIIMVIRCATLDNGLEGLKFMFKPDFSVFKGTGWLKVFAAAGTQMFFSLSLASGAIIAYGSYMKRQDNIERSAFLIPAMDTLAAILSGMMVFPAVFSAGLEPSGGPGLLFVSLQTVFASMGSFGPFFGVLFYLLVFVAAFSSSISMMEGGISTLMDMQIKSDKPVSRFKASMVAVVVGIIGGSLVALDQLGNNSDMWKPFGLGSWLDVFDLGAEGIFMPLGGFFTAVMLGWFSRGYLDDEVMIGSDYRSRGFTNLCLRWIGPIFMAFILFVQVSSFFFSQTGWYQALFM